jgi:hypothetical protein
MLQSNEVSASIGAAYQVWNCAEQVGSSHADDARGAADGRDDESLDHNCPDDALRGPANCDRDADLSSSYLVTFY